MKGDPDDQTDWTLKAHLFRGKPDEQAAGKQVGGRGQAAKETSAPSKDRGIEMKPRGVDTFICETSGSVHKMSAFSGSV